MAVGLTASGATAAGASAAPASAIDVSACVIIIVRVGDVATASPTLMRGTTPASAAAGMQPHGKQQLDKDVGARGRCKSPAAISLDAKHDSAQCAAIESAER